MNIGLVVLCFLIFTCSLNANLSADETGNQINSGPIYREVASVEELYKAIADAHPNGGTIKIKPGYYHIDKPLEIKAGMINIEGCGWNTQLIKHGDGDAISFENAGFCTVRDLLIQADSSCGSGSGIAYKGNSSSCTIDFCRICSFPNDGIRYEGNPKSPMSSNTVRNCHIIGNKNSGIYSFCNNDFYIVGNQFGTHGESPKTGCELNQSSAGTYSMNYHWGNVNALKLGPGSNFNRLENNRFEESREINVIIGGEANDCGSIYNIFTGNTFHTSSCDSPGKYPMVVANNAHSITFTSNQFFSWDSAKVLHKNSIVIGKNCDKWIVKDNIFHHNTDKAVVYDEKMNIIIKDNISE